MNTYNWKQEKKTLQSYSFITCDTRWTSQLLQRNCTEFDWTVLPGSNLLPHFYWVNRLLPDFGYFSFSIQEPNRMDNLAIARIELVCIHCDLSAQVNQCTVILSNWHLRSRAIHIAIKECLHRNVIINRRGKIARPYIRRTARPSDVTRKCWAHWQENVLSVGSHTVLLTNL